MRRPHGTRHPAPCTLHPAPCTLLTQSEAGGLRPASAADALKELLDLHIAPVYLGTRVAPSKLGQYEVAPFRLLRPAVRRMLQLHTFALKAIFTQRAKTDIHGMTIRPPEARDACSH